MSIAGKRVAILVEEGYEDSELTGPLQGLQAAGAIVSLVAPHAARQYTGKRGQVVVTNIHPASEISVSMSLLDLTLQEKVVRGSLFGSGNPRADIPKLLNLYREGQLDLDGLVTKTYTLDGVNDGYDDMRAGKNIRGVMVYS